MCVVHISAMGSRSLFLFQLRSLDDRFQRFSCRLYPHGSGGGGAVAVFLSLLLLMMLSDGNGDGLIVGGIYVYSSNATCPPWCPMAVLLLLLPFCLVEFVPARPDGDAAVAHLVGQGATTTRGRCLQRGRRGRWQREGRAITRRRGREGGRAGAGGAGGGGGGRRRPW